MRVPRRLVGAALPGGALPGGAARAPQQRRGPDRLLGARHVQTRRPCHCKPGLEGRGTTRGRHARRRRRAAVLVQGALPARRVQVLRGARRRRLLEAHVRRRLRRPRHVRRRRVRLRARVVRHPRLREADSDSAALNGCSGRGQCLDGACICDAGYTGADCGALECPRGCSARGACVGGTCECARGRSGVAATCRRRAADGCGAGVCAHGVCICPPAASGPTCATRTCPTTTRTPCSGHGDCDEATGECKCATVVGGDRRLLGAPLPGRLLGARALRRRRVQLLRRLVGRDVHAARVPRRLLGPRQVRRRRRVRVRGGVDVEGLLAEGVPRRLLGQRLLLRRRVRLPHRLHRRRLRRRPRVPRRVRRPDARRVRAAADPAAAAAVDGGARSCPPPAVAVAARAAAGAVRRRCSVKCSPRAMPLPPRLLRRRLLAEGVRQEVRAQRLLRPRDGRVRVRGGVDGADVQPQALREGVLGPRHLRRDDGRLHVRPGVRRRRLRDGAFLRRRATAAGAVYA